MRKISGILAATLTAAALSFSAVTPALATTSLPSGQPTESSVAPTQEPVANQAAATAESTDAPSTSSTPSEPSTQATPSATAAQADVPVQQPVSSAMGPFTADPSAQPAQAKSRSLTPMAASASNVFATEVLRLANQQRAANGANPLLLNTTITTGAQTWANTINSRVNNGTYDLSTIHRPDAGKSILPAGYDMYSEIIAINGTAAQVVNWWMNSPAHRAALLDKRATDIGIGSVKTTAAGWGGMSIAVANLAGYPDHRNDLTTPTPYSMVNVGDVAAVDGSGNLYIYPSAKGADLWKRTFVSGGWSNARQLLVTDFNKDGLADLLVIWKDGRLTISYGKSDGTLQAALVIGIGWNNFDISVSVWKIGDTYPSIVARNRVNGDLVLYPNANGKNFGKSEKIGIGWGSLTVFAADFDADGKQDLIAKKTNGDLLLYRGTGKGGFISETRRRIGISWNGMTHISSITNHLGTGGYGLLARTSTGNLLHYPILNNGFGKSTQIGTGGWGALQLGS